MFNFFKKKDNGQYNSLMLLIFEKLQDQYPQIYRQLAEGLIIGCRRMIQKPLPNYTNFNYNIKILNRFEDKSGRGGAIKGIFVFDQISNRYLELNVHIDYGIMIGFWVPASRKFKFDSSKIDIGKQYIYYFENEDFKELKSIIGAKQAELLNESDVNKVLLNGKDYFAIGEVEDGQYIVIDLDGKVYYASYQPFTLRLIENPLNEVLNSLK